ncbi:MAG: hypothetical protein GY715_14980 [Planctomycetes bacterium]|nr:hypothetical protein [Planctomycetota bacterium]
MGRPVTGRTPTRSLGSLVTMLVTTSIACADDPEYAITLMPTLGGVESAAYGINDAGVVVGSADVSIEDGADDEGYRAVRWDASGLLNLGILGGSDSIALDVTNGGRIAGHGKILVFGTPVQRGFVWDDGVVTTLEPLPLDSGSIAQATSDIGRTVGVSIEFDFFRAVRWTGSFPLDLGVIAGSQAWAWGMNELGDVVGWSSYAPIPVFGRHPFLDTGGGPMELGTLGGTWGWALDVNDQRQVVGESSLADGRVRAFLWQSGTMLDLGALTPESDWSRAQAINEQLQVVGWSRPTPGDATKHAFIWTGQVMHDLNDLAPTASNWLLEDAWDINDAGRIVGVGTLGGAKRGFLLTPVANAADADGDTDVDFGDILAIIGAWGDCGPTTDCAADLNGDGTVSFADVLIVIGNWGS